MLVLKKITVENFGPFAFANADIKPGLNVITGPNGTGKTMFMKALGIVADVLDNRAEYLLDPYTYKHLHYAGSTDPILIALDFGDFTFMVQMSKKEDEKVIIEESCLITEAIESRFTFEDVRVMVKYWFTHYHENMDEGSLYSAFKRFYYDKDLKARILKNIQEFFPDIYDIGLDKGENRYDHTVYYEKPFNEPFRTISTSTVLTRVFRLAVWFETAKPGFYMFEGFDQGFAFNDMPTLVYIFREIAWKKGITILYETHNPFFVSATSEKNVIIARRNLAKMNGCELVRVEDIPNYSSIIEGFEENWYGALLNIHPNFIDSFPEN